MGLMQRRKGRAYEQLIARELRAAFPAAEVRRSSQADRAANSDVVVTGTPVLERLWLELQDAREPTPVAKLAQAERDIAAGLRAGRATTATTAAVRLPVVIWHRLGARSHHVTTRLWVLDTLRGGPPPAASTESAATIVTVDLAPFIELARQAALRREQAPRIGGAACPDPTAPLDAP